MAFQQTLQGGQPTARSIPKEDNGYQYQGIKIAADVVKSMVGSSYAEAQAEKGYTAALNDYGAAKQELSSLETTLTNKTRQFETSGRPPELLAEMKALEDVIRKAKLGEGAGKLSGLSAKSRIDAAMKSAIAKFPAFASELRVHRDAVTSGGVYQTAIMESENSMQIASEEAQRLAKDMNSYGLSYFNPQDRLTYMSQAAALGRIKMQNEFLKGSLEPLKTELDLKQAQLNYEKGVWDYNNSKEDRDLDLKQKMQTYVNSVLSGRQAQFNYGKDLQMEEWNDRKTMADAKNAEENFRHYSTMNPITEAATSFNYESDKILTPLRIQEAKRNASKAEREEARVMSLHALGNRGKALVDSNLTGTAARMIVGDMKGLTIEEKLGRLSIAKSQALQELSDIFLEAGGIDSPEYKAQRQVIDDAYEGYKAGLEGGDPVKSQERLVKMRQLANKLGAYDDPTFKTHMLYTDIGMGNTFEVLSKMAFEAAGNPSKIAADQQQGVVKDLMELYKFPSELQKQLGIVASTGSASKNYTEEVELAVSLGVKNLPTAGLTPEEIANDNKLANYAKAAMNGAYGLETMTTQGAALYARSSEKGKQQYKTSFVDKFNQVASMLPDGYSLKYDKGGSLAVVQSTAEGDKVVATFNKAKYDNPTNSPMVDAVSGVKGFNEIVSSLDISLGGEFEAATNDLQHIIENYQDLIPESYAYNRENETRQGVSKEQTKGFMTQLGDFITSGTNPVYKAGEDMVKPETTIAMENYLKSTFQAARNKTAQEREKYIIDSYIQRGMEYADSYNEASKAYGVPADLLIRQGGAESAWKPDNVSGKNKSSAGAVGVAQFMERTARDMGLIVNDKVDERTDPHKSIMAQAKYMKWLYEQTGDWKSAVAAYNLGLGGWRDFKAGKRGLPRETIEYADVITGGYE